MENLADYEIEKDPFETFSKWHIEALQSEDNADAFAFATTGKDLIPSVRMLLFKELKKNAFTFFSHYNGQKGTQLEENPHGSMVFYWHNCKRQVRISGTVERLSREESMTYFASRGRSSQIASAISSQGTIIENREELLKKFDEMSSEFSDGSIPCPQTWGGFSLLPSEIEFFIYGEHRLNDRFLFKRLTIESSWDISRLQP
jgi:pyridoxamine 5'-phosphate oxidase